MDAADQEKIEASKNELHNLLDKPQLQGIPVSPAWSGRAGPALRGWGGMGAPGPNSSRAAGPRQPWSEPCPLFVAGARPGEQARPPRGAG